MVSKSILKSLFTVLIFAGSFGSVAAAELPAKVPNAQKMKALIKESIMLGKKRGQVEQKKNLFNRIGSFVIENKGCLGGTGCSQWVSLGMNYLLGAAVGLLYNFALFASTGYVVIKLQEKKLTEKEDTKAAAIVLGSYLLAQNISNLVTMLGYQEIAQTGQMPLGIRAKAKCLFQGQGCSLPARRAMVFNQGVIFSSIGLAIIGYIVAQVKM